MNTNVKIIAVKISLIFIQLFPLLIFRITGNFVMKAFCMILKLSYKVHNKTVKGEVGDHSEFFPEIKPAIKNSNE